MRWFWYRLRLLFLSIAMVGCASQPASLDGNGNDIVKDDASLKIVAVDLISVLGQLPGYDPWTMTTQVSPIRSSFGKAIVDALTDAGYGIQRVSADQGVNHVAYKESTIIESAGSSNAFEIKIRGVRVTRHYKRVKNRWIPNSPLLVYGAKPTRVKVYNELHSDGKKDTRFLSGVVFHNTNGDVLDSTEVIVGVSNSGDATQAINNAKLAERALSLSQAATFSRQRASAIHNASHYRDIAEVILKFPSSDPTRLGKSNKQAIAQLIKNSNSADDRFVIQGCVKGKTLLWDGTESLSLERQQRVNKELLVAGVTPTSIQESGCFDDDSRTGLPRQSVSVVLKRFIEPL